MRLLDRYIVRNFFQPFVYCILGFLSIWLIFDISDNSSTIFDERAPFMLVLRFYWTQIPQVLVILLPVALLLALLFSLGRMSRANEIVSMLTAGVSVPRVVLPLALHRPSNNRRHLRFELFSRRPRRAGAKKFLR